MNTLALFVALFVTNAAPVAPVSTDAGIIPVHISTVRPTRKAHFVGTHTASAPVLRRVDLAGGCTVRTLANDSSGQLVAYCN